MLLRFIDDGAVLSIAECTYDDQVLRHYTAQFHSAVTQVSFLAEGDELFNNIGKIGNDVYFRIDFFRDTKMYSFKGKLRGGLVEGKRNFTQIDQISDIKETSRRSSHRHDILLNVMVYETLSDMNCQRFLDQGVTMDISNEGLCLLTDKQYPVLEDGHLYILEFELNKDARFTLPAHLVRRGNSPQSLQYKYDYGFIFDFSKHPDEKSRLITTMFSLSLERF